MEADIFEVYSNDIETEFNLNTFASGFFPVIEAPDGSEVNFKIFEGSADTGILYYKENVMPGVYKVKGFRHLWMTHTDFMHTPIKDLKFNGQSNEKWIQKDFYPFDKKINITVNQGKMESLGKYSFKFKPFEAVEGKTENRRKAHSFVYKIIEPQNKTALSVMKNWRAGNWPEWNLKNQVSPQ
ncbi:MAG: hypothetical protein H6680_10330 [Desulfobacteraceae bacterium]|nr:hypothetical protein [Desulfobacteraceae bacterium]